VIPQRAPTVSIITATYNWSRALRCAVQSALAQTYAGFELLVVGDGCSDDSESVALSFRDNRIRWMNLPRNSGGQAIPNNHGILNSKSEYIAYLGHDDVWYPTHLETLLDTIQTTGADLAGAVMILYGPPESGVRSVSGLFPSGRFTSRDFMPPSSILHRKTLIDRIGLWKEPSALTLPADVEFQNRAFEAGAAIVSSNQLTAFNFNAACRRDSYLVRSASEQEAMLARIATGVDFRQDELIEAMRSFLSGKYVRIEAPEPRQPGELALINARYKGTSEEKVELQCIEKPTRFYLEDQLEGFEWYPLEANDKYLSYRWSGPCRFSTLVFPVQCREGMRIRVQIAGHFQDDLSKDLELYLNRNLKDSTLERCPDGGWIMHAVLGADTAGELPLRISFHVAKTQRPSDLAMNDDGRWLGIAISWVEFLPSV
jgi:hypothetical protein